MNWKRWIAEACVLFIGMFLTMNLAKGIGHEFSIVVYICGGVVAIIWDAIGQIFGPRKKEN